jgi:hypothetical protein
MSEGCVFDLTPAEWAEIRDLLLQARMAPGNRRPNPSAPGNGRILGVQWPGGGTTAFLDKSKAYGEEGCDGC